MKPFFLAALIAATVQTADAQGNRNAAFLFLSGNDTIVVERINRADNEVVAVVTSRGAPRFTLVSQLTADHLIASSRFSVHGAGTPEDADPLQSGTITFTGDSAIAEIDAGGRQVVQRLGTKKDALLLVNNDLVSVEQGVRRARMLNVDRLVQPMFALTGGVTLDAIFELFASDSARVTIAGNVTVVSIDVHGNVTGGYLPGQGIVIKVLEGEVASRVLFGNPDYSPPDGAPYVAEDVTVSTRAGHQLAGTLTLPSGAEDRFPAIVTITGSGQQDRDEFIPIADGYRLFNQVADTLSRRGIAVLRMDDRGVGGSGGDIHGTTRDFADDIIAGIEYLRSRQDIDPGRIALVGHSEGGLIAPMIAAEDPTLTAIVIMAGPSKTGREVLEFQNRQAIENDTRVPASARDSAFKVAMVQLDSAVNAIPWLKYLHTHDPLPVLKNVGQPVLIMHGATDRQVTVDQADEIEKVLLASGNTRVKKSVFTDRNHLFLHDPDGNPSGYQGLQSARVDSEVLGTLADWLASVLMK